MPTYKIQLPDGRTLTTQAPDQATAIAGAQAWFKANPKGSATYNARRAADTAHPSVMGAAQEGLETVSRAIPGASEFSAGLGAGLNAMGNVMSGKPANLSAEWQKQRDTQQADVDQFRSDHPVMSDLATGTGLAAQAVPLVLSGGATAAPESIAGAGLVARGARAGQTVVRNAMTGATLAGVNAASKPGTLEQRSRNAMAAIPTGAALGVAVPAAAGAAGTLVRAAGRVAAPAASVAAETASGLSRAVTGKTVADQVGSSRVDLQACKLEYSIVSPK